jgi:hypothetical protein
MNLQITKNYEMFELTLFNRNVTKTKKLEESMKNHGYINAYPLHCIKEKGKLKIKSGHHRFTVAQMLDLPVAYVVCDDTATIHELEDSTIKWELKDYLDSFVRMGKVDYITVKEYSERTGIPVGQCLSIFSGESGGVHSNWSMRFKKGEFVISKKNYAEKLAEILNIMRQCGISFSHERSMVVAISRILKAGHADFIRLKNKISLFTFMITKCATVDQYMDVIEAVYNRKVGVKTPLKMLTEQSIKDASVINKHKQL